MSEHLSGSGTSVRGLQNSGSDFCFLFLYVCIKFQCRAEIKNFNSEFIEFLYILYCILYTYVYSGHPLCSCFSL